MPSEAQARITAAGSMPKIDQGIVGSIPIPLPSLDEQIKTRQAELDHLVQAIKPIETAAQIALSKKQTALTELQNKKPPKAKKTLA